MITRNFTLPDFKDLNTVKSVCDFFYLNSIANDIVVLSKNYLDTRLYLYDRPNNYHPLCCFDNSCDRPFIHFSTSDNCYFDYNKSSQLLSWLHSVGFEDIGFIDDDDFPIILPSRFFID